MRKPTFVAMIIFVAMTVPATRSANALLTSAIDGNYLLKACAAEVQYQDDQTKAPSSEDLISLGICTGYIDGAADFEMSMQLEDSARLRSKNAFCIPLGATPNQTIRVVVKWLREHPGRLHENAARLLRDALIENFPCRT